MTLADLSVKRPIFVSCLAVLLFVMGWLSFQKMPVDLFPDVTFPIVMVQTQYSGAGPAEVEILVSKVIEEEMSTLPGIKTISSINNEGFSTVVAEFTLETDVKYAEQQVRDRVGSAKPKLPDDVKDSVIRRLDPADQPIVILSLAADNMSAAKLYDLANLDIKPKIEQVSQVGLVEITGGRKREIHVELDRKKLKSYDLSATQVSSRIAAAGQNIPAGKVSEGKVDTVFRTLGEFKNVKDIGDTIINFLGNDIPVKVSDLAFVRDTLKDETSRAFLNGTKSIFLMVYRQSGSNTIQVVDSVKKKVDAINKQLQSSGGADKPTLKVVRDGSRMIHANVDDVKESIMIGVLLTIIVVYLFLGSGRSTMITGLAIPNSLVGAFLLMSMFNFSINVMSLLALSLAVGLLIDDAIVVRENIFRHMEMGKSPIRAALDGTKEVGLAVIATTGAVLAVFGPIGFLSGVVGQFFKQFGLTVCFAMAISLFDALTIAPMLSAYVGGMSHGKRDRTSLWGMTMGLVLEKFDQFQTFLENKYAGLLRVTIRHPMVAILFAIVVFVMSLVSVKWIPKTFMSPQDTGEFSVALKLDPGANLDQTSEMATKIDQVIRANSEVQDSVMFVGGQKGETNVATFFVTMIPSKDRKINTILMKEKVRQQLKPFVSARPIVKDIDMVGGGQRAFNVNIMGNDLVKVEEISNKLLAYLKTHPGLSDVESNYENGKPEFQVRVDQNRAERLGISTTGVGLELRTLIEGSTPAVFREKGEEYDIRVRLKEDQRNLKLAYDQTYVPNINGALVRLQNVAQPLNTTGPAVINRQDRGRYIQISGDMAAKGPGMAAVMSDIEMFMINDVKLPADVRYKFVGQAENFQELGRSMLLAVGLGILFLFMVLASLYESVVTPLTIMLVLPLAICGAFYALLVTGKALDLFTMIGCIMLLGMATKNSILLVDYTNQLVQEGMDRSKAIVEAGRVRLRPILMTTLALIAGMLPIAIGLNEASRQRTGMGVAIIGGMISSTLLTLVVVPAAYSYIERFRVWSAAQMKRLSSDSTSGHEGQHAGAHATKAKDLKGRGKEEEDYEGDPSTAHS
jgi:HAE1 family hydrophobic/amphiphilic exporter-1